MTHLTIGNAQVTVFPTASELFAAAADEFFRIVTTSLAERNVANIALSGGSTPRSLYDLIAERATKNPQGVRNPSAPKSGALGAPAGKDGRIDWRKVHLFFGDERSVPPTDKESNYRMVRESLLSNAALGATRVHRIHSELPPENAAELYEGDLKEHFGHELPQFDLILLGLGPDGHTASLFPDTTALNVTDRWVVANEVPQQKTVRITFTYPLLNNASEVLFLVVGAEKSEAIKHALIARDVPAAQVQPRGRLLWYVDLASAVAIAHR